VRSRSTRTSRSRSSGSIPGSTRRRRPTPPRRSSIRAPTSSPSTPTRRPRCRSRSSAASMRSGNRPT
jgi:hypothetical protein